MSILERQSRKVTERELIRYLLLGSLPNITDLTQRLQDVRFPGSLITYKHVPQEYRAVFNIDTYNKALSDIKFDIDVFNEELNDLFVKASNKLNYADLFFRLNSKELDRLSEELNLLLFINNNADFYFSGFVENFISNTNTDTSKTTEGLVDLIENVLALPYRGRNTKRIDVGSLVSEQNVDVEVTGATGGPSGQPNSLELIPNSVFGSIFTDDLNVWGYKVLSTQDNPVSISFTFPLNPDGVSESEFFVSRFEFNTHGLGTINVKIEVSNDNVNFLALNGYEGGVDTNDSSKTYGLDFETNLVEYVRVTLTKNQPDSEVSGTVNNPTSGSANADPISLYEYIFGLKRFAAFQTGRIQNGVYFSKPISFSSLEDIGKVSIDTENLIPSGTSINFSIAKVIPGKDNKFIPITPVNSSGKVGENKILQFNSSEEITEKFTVASDSNSEDAAVVYGTPFQGKEFYRIGPAIPQIPQFETSKLFRGFNGWYRDKSGSFEILEVTDNYVPFEQTDLERVYVLQTEQVTAANYTSTDDIIRKRLQVSRPPYYDNTRGHALKPEPGVQNSLLDVRPNYAIYRVLHNTDTDRQYDSFTLSSNRLQYLPSSSFVIETNNQAALLPSITSANGTIVYQEGSDYIFEVESIGGQSKPTGRISIPEGSAFLDANNNVQTLSLVFTYVADPDITHKVSSIQGNNIILVHSQNLPQDSIEVIYRYVPVAPSAIIRSSVRVSNLPTTSNSRIFYVEGRDYSFDPSTGAIQRIPTGEIGTTDSVYVQFSYRGASSSLETFTAWAFVAAGESERIKFDLNETTQENKLTVDETIGESFFINTTEGLINLTKAPSTPVLPGGWVQFVVRSKNPDLNQTYGSNLIDQVIQLKDVNNKKIFRSFNIYFNEITAFRQPLKEVTLNHLKVNTLLSNHNVFAVDSITDPFNSYIVLNFRPNLTEELYLKVPTEDGDETNPPRAIDEEYMFVWFKKISTETVKSNSLIVKIELSRNASVDGAITPKCIKYQLRVGP